VRLVAGDETIQSIEIIRELGFLAIKADSAVGDPLQGRYTAKTVRTMNWKLQYGLGAVTWGTVAEPSGKLESEVKPGIYRLVLTYLAPGQVDVVKPDKENVGETSALICLYISAPFELTRPFFLFEFEGGEP
jgi:hypothetical protein